MKSYPPYLRLVVDNTANRVWIDGRWHSTKPRPTLSLKQVRIYPKDRD